MTIQGTSVPVCKTAPSAALPTLTAGTTVIDAYTQPGAATNTNPLSAGDNAIIAVQLDGTSAGGATHGLVIQGANDTVEGLAVTGFGGYGVRLAGQAAHGNVIVGDFVGILADGRTAAPNGVGSFGGGGVLATSSSNYNTIGGTSPAAADVISGNSSGYGVEFDSGGNTLEGSYVGTNAAGTAAVGNHASGVMFRSPGDTIGGPGSGAGNVISGNGGRERVLRGCDGRHHRGQPHRHQCRRHRVAWQPERGHTHGSVERHHHGQHPWEHRRS